MNKVLNDLIFLGKADETIELFGHKWEMHTLSTDEQIEVVTSTSDYDEAARVAAIQLAALSRAITKVDGEPTGTVSDTYELLSQIQAYIVSALYDKYDIMASNQINLLGDMKEIKNSQETTLRA
jgi:hypothetical protein